MTELIALYQRLADKVRPRETRRQTMQSVVDVLWDGLHAHDVSWVGFYIDQPQEPDDRRLVLGPRRDKPACSPIGLHGVCGSALRGGQCIIVEDVRALGSAYVACDPNDRSELVVPLLDGGTCWGVLDLDSFTPGRFDETDRDGCRSVLHAAGFTPA